MASKLDEKEMTFAPKINNRPAFLGAPKPLNKVPAYKLAFSYSNDPMEKPLPGKSSYQSNEPAPDTGLDIHDRQYSLGFSSRGGQTTAPLTPVTPITDANILSYRITHDSIGRSAASVSTAVSATNESAPKSRLSLLKSKLRQAEATSMSQKVSSSGPVDKGDFIDASSGGALLSKGSYPYQSSPALLPSRSSGLSGASAFVTPPVSGRLLPRRSSPAAGLSAVTTEMGLSAASIRGQAQSRESIPSTEYFKLAPVSVVNTPVKQLFLSNTSSPETLYATPQTSNDIFDHIDSDIGYNELSECAECGRRFNPTAYEKHVKVCKKVFQSQRKIFDSKKMRIQDNPELVKILTQREREEAKLKGKSKNAEGNLLKSSSAKAPVVLNTATATATNRDSIHRVIVGGSQQQQQQQPKWKADSELFRQMMKNARDTSKAMAEGKPLPPPVKSAPDPSLVPCPHCGRNFNEKAAERHIPVCVNIRAKPTSLRRGDGKNGLAGAASVSTLRISRKLY